MSDVKLGALCWNQYTDWPSPPGRRPAGRPARLRHALDVGPPLPDQSATPSGPILEGWLTLTAWAQATERIRIGLMVGANTFREPGPHREDGDDPRPHLGRPGDPRASARPGSRRSTKRSASSSGAASRSGCAGSARRSRSCAGCSMASARRRPARATRRRPSATTRRRSRSSCRCSSAAAARRSRSSSWHGTRDCQQPRRRDRERAAEGGHPPPALRDRRARPGRDRADGEHRDGRHPRLARRGRTGPRRGVRAKREGQRCGRISRSGRRRTSPSACCRSSASATAT